ncbi:MAG: AAA family ATPase, partial [Armatimonadota bacterium]
DELRGQRDESATWLATLRHEFNTTAKSGERLQAEQTRLTADLPALAEVPDLEALEKQRDTLVRALAAKSSDAEKAGELIREAEARAALASQRQKELERRVQGARDGEQHRIKRTSNLGPERNRLQQVIADATVETERLTLDVAANRDQLTQTLSARTEALEKVRSTEELVRESQRAIHGLNDSLHKSELARARAEGKRNAALERLLEEYGMLAEEAEQSVAGKELPSDAGPLASRLRKELKEMGDVNLGAIDAYDRLNARYDELTGQSEDILQGKQEVEGSIRELDRMTRDRFVSTFKAVQVAFAASFRQIFGDGEGSLELDDPENVLDSGVEIAVQVPGKKRQRLELLSGGERALAAMAFLFALIKVKPTPLVILDEIDAPLDGRNVERFIGIMRELAAGVQFILITHNPVTIESADLWFGVTMQEPGVSTLVPVRVPDRRIVAQ